MEPICRRCGQPVQESFYFCPNCGKKIKEPPPSTSLSAQSVVYLVSLFLPPLGLIYAYKYSRHGGTKEKYIAVAAVVLTCLVIYLQYTFLSKVWENVSQTLEALNATSSIGSF